MRLGFLLLTVFTMAPAKADPISTLAGLWSVLNHCTRAVIVPIEAEGSEITILFSIKRDGNLQGKPRVTYAHLTGEAAVQKAFVGAAFATIARCFPLPITDELGGAVAGRPLRLRISG